MLEHKKFTKYGYGNTFKSMQIEEERVDEKSNYKYKKQGKWFGMEVAGKIFIDVEIVMDFKYITSA